MRRFYKKVSVVSSHEEHGNLYAVSLDGKTLKSAQDNVICFPQKKIIDLLAAEWSAAPGVIKASSMPVTRILSHATDMDENDRADTTKLLLNFLPTDLCVIRADYPAELKDMQDREFAPLISKATDIISRHGCADFGGYLDCMSPLELVLLQESAQICHSVYISLALLEGGITAEEAIRLSSLEELYQESRWGKVPESVDRRKNLMDELYIIKSVSKATKFTKS